MEQFLVSVIIPVYQEEKNIHALLTRLLPTLQKYQYEILFVDDGSRDGTGTAIKAIAKDNPALKYISFYRNFGHQMALTCGYRLAKGNCVITMDADLQDSPEIIDSMIAKWKDGAKVVYAKRNVREAETPFKLITASLFYRFLNFLSDTRIPQNVGDFRLLDRDVVSFLNNLHEQSRFLRGLVAWGGYPAEYVYFKRERRHAGKTHYTLSKMINFALDGITSFSTKPLRITTYIGFITACLGFVGSLYAVIGKYIFASSFVSGWAALFAAIMFFGGVQIMSIGIIGEYIAKMYQELQQRPQYLIKEQVNV